MNETRRTRVVCRWIHDAVSLDESATRASSWGYASVRARLLAPALREAVELVGAHVGDAPDGEVAFLPVTQVEAFDLSRCAQGESAGTRGPHIDVDDVPAGLVDEHRGGGAVHDVDAAAFQC